MVSLKARAVVTGAKKTTSAREEVTLERAAKSAAAAEESRAEDVQAREVESKGTAVEVRAELAQEA